MSETPSPTMSTYVPSLRPSFPPSSWPLLLLSLCFPALHSCERSIPLHDARTLTGVSLVTVPADVPLSSTGWKEGETKVLRIACEPGDIMISDFSLACEEEGMAGIGPTDVPGTYELRALRCGVMHLVPSATDTHGTTVSDRIAVEVLSPDIPLIYETTYPDLRVQRGETPKPLGGETVLRSGEELLLELSSSNEGATFSLSSSDPEVVGVQSAGQPGREGSTLWNLKAGRGGKATLCADLSTPGSQRYRRTYTLWVYSHVDLRLEVNPVESTIGLSVLRCGAPSTRQLSYLLRGNLLTWPGGLQQELSRVPLPDSKGTIPLAPGTYRPDLCPYAELLTLIHAREPYFPEGAGEPLYWSLGAVELEWSFEVADDPFVVIDSLTQNPSSMDMELSFTFSQGGVQRHVGTDVIPPLERVP